jgi:hypothetical protein
MSIAISSFVSCDNEIGEVNDSTTVHLKTGIKPTPNQNIPETMGIVLHNCGVMIQILSQTFTESFTN